MRVSGEARSERVRGQQGGVKTQLLKVMVSEDLVVISTLSSFNEDELSLFFTSSIMNYHFCLNHFKSPFEAKVDEEILYRVTKGQNYY